MKKIQQHILKGKKIYVGLEDSKRTWKFCVRSGGVMVHEASMPVDYSMLRNYFHNKFPDCSITVMYEAGFRGFSLYDQLVNDGWHCVVTPPHTVTEEKCSRRKNDRIDCRRLAKNLENRDYKTCYVPDKQLREDRQISRLYSQIQNDIVRVCNRIRRTLEFHGLDEQFAPGKWRTNHYRSLLGKLDSMTLSDSLRYSLKTMFSELTSLWQLRRDVLRQLKALAKSDCYCETVAILKSAPGIGLLTAIRLTLEWGDVSRFKRKEEFACFTGLIPSDNSTGERVRMGHITKQGNRWSRSWLIESSWVAIRYDPVLMDKFQVVAHNSGSKKKAIVAVARMYSIRLRALLITRQQYVIGTLQRNVPKKETVECCKT